METIETTQFKGLTVKIHPDYDHHESEAFKNPEPFHTYGSWNRYELFEFEGRGDDFTQHIFNEYNAEIVKRFKSLDYSNYLEDYENAEYYDEKGVPTRERAEELVQKWIDSELIILPIYVYEHSGITMRAGSGFSCSWDSGQAGFIYISKAEARTHWNSKRVDNKNRRVIEKMMVERVEYLAAICEGSIYGFTIEDSDGDVISSCWGFVETAYPIEKTYVYAEAMEEAGYEFDALLSKHLSKRKAEIINRVPLRVREPFNV